jgi:U3 small nucleolar ribonucleoprotein component
MKKYNIDQEELDLDIESVETTPKKRKKYVTQKGVELEGLLNSAREYKFSYKPIPINLKEDIEDIKNLTKSACIRPDLYFDNDDSCVKCHIYENCACPLKNLGKKGRK